MGAWEREKEEEDEDEDEDEDEKEEQRSSNLTHSACEQRTKRQGGAEGSVLLVKQWACARHGRHATLYGRNCTLTQRRMTIGGVVGGPNHGGVYTPA